VLPRPRPETLLLGLVGAAHGIPLEPALHAFLHAVGEEDKAAGAKTWLGSRPRS
jgi:urease accessory protein UreF